MVEDRSVDSWMSTKDVSTDSDSVSINARAFTMCVADDRAAVSGGVGGGLVLVTDIVDGAEAATTTSTPDIAAGEGGAGGLTS